MDKDTLYVLNDYYDAIEELTNIVQELNPGATRQIARIRFMLQRAERTLTQHAEDRQNR